ncbi:hypothetical protein V1477_012388 [Vespula maculifrons]|uniref:Uncharacterized protein n=1 Tax=Vespula maculifrons TaxID=7453 RepID=A0ABD2BXC8_VESMC
MLHVLGLILGEKLKEEKNDSSLAIGVSSINSSNHTEKLVLKSPEKPGLTRSQSFHSSGCWLSKNAAAVARYLRRSKATVLLHIAHGNGDMVFSR